MEDDSMRLMGIEECPLPERAPARRLCPTCGGWQTCTGYYEWEDRRIWMYAPAECKCHRVYELHTAIIKVARAV